MISNKYFYFLILIITSYAAQTSYNNQKVVAKQLAHLDRILDNPPYPERFQANMLKYNYHFSEKDHTFHRLYRIYRCEYENAIIFHYLNGIWIPKHKKNPYKQVINAFPTMNNHEYSHKKDFPITTEKINPPPLSLMVANKKLLFSSI